MVERAMFALLLISRWVLLGQGAPSLPFALDADIPALLRKGALGALAGQLDLARSTLTFGSRGIEIPHKVNAILSVVDFLLR